MANTLSAAIPKILAQGLIALREFCVMPRLVNTDYATEARQKGDTIDVPIPSAIAVADVAPAAFAPNPADASLAKAQIQLSYWREAAFYLTDKDILEAMNGAMPMQASEAVRALANDVNAKIFTLYTGIYGFTGTPGTTPFGADVGAATGARKVLNKQLAPLNPRYCVLDPDAEANALGLRAFQDASWRADGAGIVEGQIGRKLGFNFFIDQQTPTHIAGTLSDGSAHQALFNGGGSPQTLGATTMNLDATTLTGTVVKGDVFTVAGDAQTYTVTSGPHTAAGNAIAGIAFAPAAKVAWADNAQVSFKGTHVVNLAFHRDAIALAVRRLEDAAVAAADRESMMSAVDPVSQLALRLEVRREHKRMRWSYDILYGVGLVRPELACRIAG